MWSLFVLVGVSVAAVATAATYEKFLDIPPRYQWNHNFGYCGEVTLISAGLSLGQYLSQYDSRVAACGDKDQNRCEMLLGVNDETAAKNMHFNYEEWSPKVQITKDFLVWVKQKIVAGNLVGIGVYTNEYLFYNDNSPTAGDSEYDHIVPVIGITSSHPLNDTTYYGDDIITFSDNGLWGLQATAQYLFNYTFDDFQGSRKQANDKNGNVYTLSNTGSNYGIAVSGIKDANSETIPVRIDTDKNYESPEIAANSDTRPKSMPLTLTVTVTNTATDGHSLFNLYQYDKLANIPETNFNANAYLAETSRSLRLDPGESYTFTAEIDSFEQIAYRCVRG